MKKLLLFVLALTCVNVSPVTAQAAKIRGVNVYAEHIDEVTISPGRRFLAYELTVETGRRHTYLTDFDLQANRAGASLAGNIAQWELVIDGRKIRESSTPTWTFVRKEVILTRGFHTIKVYGIAEKEFRDPGQLLSIEIDNIAFDKVLPRKFGFDEEAPIVILPEKPGTGGQTPPPGGGGQQPPPPTQHGYTSKTLLPYPDSNFDEISRRACFTWVIKMPTPLAEDAAGRKAVVDAAWTDVHDESIDIAINEYKLRGVEVDEYDQKGPESAYSRIDWVDAYTWKIQLWID